MIGIKAIKPEESKIVLRNGREIGYDHLVIAAGLLENLEGIKGFEEGWADPVHPVFTAKGNKDI
jgi:NADH dehydrogenase FAD-containing subunit